MTERSLPTETVTFLFTDIEGSTKRWERLPAAMAAAVARHDRSLRSAIEECGGYVFKTVGDAFCAAFQTPSAALLAALAGQRALAGDDWTEIDGLRVRMALHTGQAEERDADYFGPTVNRVARLLSAGHGGQVLISDATREALTASLPTGIELRNLGERRLKDLTQPERIFQLLAPDLADAFPPLATLDARPNNLPAQPTPLLGRDVELSSAKERLRRASTRILTLTGPGGTGKTRLSLQVAADLIDDYANGVWFVDLGAVVDPKYVVAEVADALDVREEGGRPLEEQLLDSLREQELLLVLDNFEQVLPAAGFVAKLVGACPRVQVLVTSRVRLRLSGEQEYPVPPLGLPNLKRLPAADHLLAFPAVELFVQRAAATKHDFVLTAENAPAVAEICVALDGLPLAIELAAARVKLLPPQAMLPRLERRLKLLTGGARDRAERQQTLRGAIAWSYDLLPDGERQLLARLSVFGGGCTFDAAETICNYDGDLAVDLLEGFDALVEHSLIRQEETPDGEPRFRMLATIREFAAEQLEARGDTVAIRRAHAGHFLAFAEQGRPALTGPDQAKWLDQLQSEHDNLRLALETFHATSDGVAQLRLADAMWVFWYIRGHLSEGSSRLERALANGDSAPSATRAAALDGAGLFAHSRREDERAKRLFESALGLFQELGDRHSIAGVLDHLGSMAQESSTPDYEAAAALLEESLALRRELADKHGIAASLNNLGNLSHMRGNYESAVEHYQEAVALSRESDNPFMEALSLGNLAMGIRETGDHTSAARLYKDAIAILKDVGDLEGIADSLSGLALIAIADGQASHGMRLFGAAEALRDAAGCSLEAIDQAQLDDAIASARLLLGTDESASARAFGRTLSVNEAIAEAMALSVVQPATAINPSPPS